ALGQLLGGDEPRVPTVVPCGATHRRPRVAADPDGRVRLLDGLRREGNAVEVDVGAVVLPLVAGPELDHRREVLVGHATALVERGPEHLELALRVPDADRDSDPASGEEVERRDRLREHHGVVVRHHDHRRVDDQARGGTGDEGHRGQGVRPERSHQLDHVGGDDDVLRDRDGVEAEVVGGAGHPLEVLRAERGLPVATDRRIPVEAGEPGRELHGRGASRRGAALSSIGAAANDGSSRSWARMSKCTTRSRRPARIHPRNTSMTAAAKATASPGPNTEPIVPPMSAAMGTPPAVSMVYRPITRPRKASGATAISRPWTTVLNEKNANP